MGNKEQNNQIKNGPIIFITRIQKIVVASTAEAEVASLNHTAQAIISFWPAEEELRHKQHVKQL